MKDRWIVLSLVTGAVALLILGGHHRHSARAFQAS
jgi:hypothetical protein